MEGWSARGGATSLQQLPRGPPLHPPTLPTGGLGGGERVSQHHHQPTTQQQEQQYQPQGSSSVLQQQQRAPGSSSGQQQQHAEVSPLSPRASHALELYQEYVMAGQWVKLTLEQRPEGEYVTLSSRPTAAPAAKGSKHPNKRRMEILAARKATWQQRRQQQRQHSMPARTTCGSQQQPVLTGSSSNQQQQQPVRNAHSTTAEPVRSFAAVAATPAATTQQPHSKPRLELDSTPRLTRARKKRKADPSPANVSPPRCAIPQLDGAAPTPPSPSCPTPSPTQPSPPPPTSSTPGMPSPPTATPPEPPSPLSPPPTGVLCKICETIEHSDTFFMCAECHWKWHDAPYRDCPDCKELWEEYLDVP